MPTLGDPNAYVMRSLPEKYSLLFHQGKRSKKSSQIGANLRSFSDSWFYAAIAVVEGLARRDQALRISVVFVSGSENIDDPPGNKKLPRKA